MTPYESSGTAEVPVDILDRLLWRDAQQTLSRHSAPEPDGTCGWCGWHWPCPPRRLAERAEVASRLPWREAWTARHDPNRLGGLPSWQSGPSTAAASPESTQPHRNAGLFD
jgi:hypothetical protein